VRNVITAESKSGRPFDVNFRLVDRDGEPTRWIRCRGRSQTDDEGKISRIGGTLVDISDRMALQTEIESQRQSLIHLSRVGTVGTLTGAFAHELSQPLTAILHNAQAIERMLDQQPINMRELRSAISDIIEDDCRVSDVIRHLRALLKKDSSGFSQVDMTLLIHKVIGLVRKELALHHVKVAVKIAPNAPPVWGDDVQLQQLLLNLITNAIDAIQTSGKRESALTITAYGAGSHGNGNFHVCISDTGDGLTTAAMATLFDPFYSTKEHGLGLGLAISQAIVNGHKGSIRAENNSQGGAVFHVTLPAAREKAA
jgi:two-component system sensor kinase FixL